MFCWETPMSKKRRYQATYLRHLLGQFISGTSQAQARSNMAARRAVCAGGLVCKSGTPLNTYFGVMLHQGFV